MPFGERLHGRIRQGLYNPLVHDPTLVLDLPFSEGVGDTVRDRSLYGNHGTIYGASWIDGKIGKALSFDGVDNRVIIPHSSSLMPASELSILMWIYPRSWEPADVYLAKQDYGSEGYYVQQGTTSEENFAFWVRTSADNAFGVDIGSHMNVWSHIACVFKADDYMKIYRDGILKDSTAPASGNIVANIGSLKIGNFWEGNWTDYAVDSIIDEVRIYKRVLTASEILRLYNEQK